MITARFDPHVHLLPPERTAGLMRWLHRGLPGVGIPADITAEDALADLRAAGAHALVNLLFPLRPGEAEELHRFGAELSRNDPGVIPVGGVHAEDPDPESVVRTAIEEQGMRGLKLHPMVQRFSPGHPALEPALAALAEYGLPLYVHTGFDDWYGWGYDLSELERIAERHPSIPLVLCHCAFPRIPWATEMARRHPQVWLDTTNVFGSIALAPAGESARGSSATSKRRSTRRRTGSSSERITPLRWAPWRSSTRKLRSRQSAVRSWKSWPATRSASCARAS